ncbi:MAG: hypothetical protein OEY09_12395 [Gammaproteobacteria bacterium]|nr:hypothetical protein [Gammaproteobacteria bacterium]
MSDLIEPSSSTAKNNPLFWISLVVIGLILFIFFGTDRGVPVTANEPESKTVSVGTINRNLLVPPGMRARQLIEQVREEGKPYPLPSMFEKAHEYDNEGSLADAHLLYFFTAREGFEPAMMKMGEISDPTLFESENSLLDRADAIQSYKWYRKLADLGQTGADEKIQKLQQWAFQASISGDPDARQLLLLTR